MAITGCAVVVAALLVILDLHVVLKAFSILAVAAAAAGLTVWLSGRYVRRGLAAIESAIASGERPTGTSEFHKCAGTLYSYVQRWANAAASGREQMRDIEVTLGFLDRRTGPADSAGNRNAAAQLKMLLNSLGRESRNAIKDMIACNRDIDLIGTQVMEAAKQQNDAAGRATRLMESLASEVTSLVTSAGRAEEAVSVTETSLGDASEEMSLFWDQLQAVRDNVAACEAKTRLLREQTVEIGALVQSISEHSTKTDMLALNASIESVRAGELGRGFAVVAEEIRKLASHIATSSQDVLERVASIEGEVDVATGMMANEQAAIVEQIEQADSVRSRLAHVRGASKEFQDYLKQLNQASESQLQRISEVAKTLEDILEASECARGSVQEGTWKTRSVTDLIVRLTDLLEPLMVSSQTDAEEQLLDEGDVPVTSDDDVTEESVDMRPAEVAMVG